MQSQCYETLFFKYALLMAMYCKTEHVHTLCSHYYHGIVRDTCTRFLCQRQPSPCPIAPRLTL